MTTTAHSNCDHAATRAARAACRAARASRLNLAHNLVTYFDEVRSDSIADWLLKGARRFARDMDAARAIADTDRLALALSLLDYFDPQESDAWIARRKQDGYTITRDPATIRSIILRAFS